MKVISNRQRKRGAQWDRRRFLKAVGLGTVALMKPGPALAAVAPSARPARTLALYNIHTHERLTGTYWHRGDYDPAALKKINHLLRDHRTGEVSPIDTGVLNLLHRIKVRLACEEPFHIISGYRSPRTNALLRKQGRGVAKKSLHMSGKAVDIRIPGCRLGRLRQVALDLEAGGVGYYPSSGFVHVDIGPVRFW